MANHHKIKVITSICPSCLGKAISNDGINWECINKKCGKKINIYKQNKNKMWV